MPWKKLSPAQHWLMQRLEKGPLEVDKRIVGSGWVLPQGLKISTVDALVKMGAVRREISGTGILRKMTLTSLNPKS